MTPGQPISTVKLNLGTLDEWKTYHVLGLLLEAELGVLHARDEMEGPDYTRPAGTTYSAVPGSERAGWRRRSCCGCRPVLDELRGGTRRSNQSGHWTRGRWSRRRTSADKQRHPRPPATRSWHTGLVATSLSQRREARGSGVQATAQPLIILSTGTFQPSYGVEFGYYPHTCNVK